MQAGNILCVFILLVANLLLAGPVVLPEGQKQIFIENNTIEIFEDTSGHLMLEDVLIKGKFKKNNSDFFSNKNIQSTYWVKFDIINHSDDPSKWLLEQFNYRINDLTLYLIYPDGRIKNISLGDNRNFESRRYQHKNLIYPLELPKNQVVKAYLRFTSNHSTPFQLVFRDRTFFTSYALQEYFLLGLFYGIILIFAVYNFFLLFSFKDKAYLFYVLYVLSFGAYFMVMDGTGFQYLWFDFPQLNSYAYTIFLTLTVIWMILYIKTFLNISEKMPFVNKILNSYLVFRLGFFIVGLFYSPVREITYLELFPFAIMYFAAIYSFKKGYKPARYLVLSFSILFSVFIIHLFRIAGYLPSNVFTFYSLYLVPIIEIVMLSLAQAERIRGIRDEQVLGWKLNDELELKVAERTALLKIQNEFINEKMANLDTFIYKVTHDLKGPLKSIIGLAKSAKMDKKGTPDLYFDFIIKSSERLDAVITDLLSISRTSGKDLNFTAIDLKLLLIEIVESLNGDPENQCVDIELNINQNKEFYSERTLLSSIFQNLIENAIRYRNTSLPKSYLKIKVEETDDGVIMEFQDNGIGISKENLPRIFEMFYRADEHHHHKSTGLGLYMVKLALNRLNSQIEAESQEGIGTTFILHLRSIPPVIITPEETAEIGLA